MKFKIYRFLVVCTTTVLIASCANPVTKESYRSPLVKENDTVVDNGFVNNSINNPEQPQKMIQLEGIQFEVSEGFTDDAKNSPNLNTKPELKVAIEKMPMPDFIHYTFGKLLNLNYIMNESLLEDKSEISLNIDDLISQKDLFDLIQQLMAEKKLDVSFDNQVVMIKEHSQSNKSELIAFGYGNQVEDIPKSGDKVVQMVPLKFAEHSRISRVLPRLVKIQIIYDNDTNSLVFTGSYQEVKRALSVTKTLDVPSAKSRFINMFDLTFITADEFISTVSELLKKDGLSVSSNTAGALTFTKLPHINSIIVHAANETVLERLEMWRKQLDVAGDTDESKYFVYHSKYADVEDLGESLTSILALKSNIGLVSSPKTNTSDSSTSNSKKQSGFASSNVAIDTKRNTLTFYMAPAEYQTLLPIIEQLDVQAKQVIIEVTLMEVTLTGKLSYGLEWYMTNTNAQFGTQGGLGGIGGGLTFNFSRPNLDILFNMLESDNLVNILSNPKLLVTDGESASINIGTEIPVLSGIVEGESGQVRQDVGTKNTGITLNIGVQVTSGNQVSLEIDQQLSEAGENQLSSVDSPTVLKRQFQTKVTAKSGRSIMLAGLISENKSEAATSVPLLSKIPLLGNIFETNSKSNTRTELVVLITPRVIESDTDLESITEALSSVYKRIEF
ncbi:MAG: hypothetical protein HWE10_07250 [Gammaproteobacteria bacterium]|nr:hypothetical protein [Gammaproteobacteria bacterium]